MTLYLIGTPIGNLKDMTLRAIETLKVCPVILVEKWSDSVKLLKHYDIKPEKIMTYDDRNCRRVTPSIIEILKEKNIAFITSAGTPGVSDPGAYLINACRQEGIMIVPIPGPSALSVAVGLSGFSGNFLFVNFLPKKKIQLTKILATAEQEKYNLVFFESTYRLAKTLAVLVELYPNCSVFLGKEMTKKFEQYLVAYPAELLAKLQTDKKFIRGEFTLVVNFAE